jgi:LysR family transcriptional regulator, regulator for genes of the gallate degradation pathway
MLMSASMSEAIPNLRHLRLLQGVVQCGSVSAAARVMHMTQPAVTQAINGLEIALQSRLFQRSPRGMEPTAAGRVLAHRVLRCLHQLHEGCVEAAGQRMAAIGTDPIGALPGITPTQLRVLIGVTDQGSIGAAARTLKIARSTAHCAVRELERVLGGTLFEQTSFGLRATREAGRLARRALLAFAEIDQARAEIAALGGQESGRTVIGAMPLARSRLVPTAVLAFADRCPGHTVSILDGSYENMVDSLRRGAADILVGALRDPVPHADIVQEPLFEDPLSLIVRMGHPLAGQTRPTLRDLSEFAWIAPRKGSPLRHRYEALVEKIKPAVHSPVPAPIECNSLVAARALLLASDRVMLLSAHQAYFELAAGQLTALAHPLGPVSRPIGLTMRRDWAPTETQGILVDLLRDQGKGAAEVALSVARNVRGDTRILEEKKRVK